MGQHDIREYLDKAQRDEILEWLNKKIFITADSEEKFFGKALKGKTLFSDDLRILKSLKAMVESFDTTEKHVEDSGSVRHEQRVVTGNDVKKVARRWLITPFRLGESLKELGIKVTDKEKEADKTMQRREERGAYLRNPKRIGTRYKVTDKEG